MDRSIGQAALPLLLLLISYVFPAIVNFAEQPVALRNDAIAYVELLREVASRAQLVWPRHVLSSALLGDRLADAIQNSCRYTIILQGQYGLRSGPFGS